MSDTAIPMLDLEGEVDSLWGPLQEAIARVLRSGHFILGPEVEAFEREVAAFLGTKHALGLNSGTDALVIALRALGLGEGDEIVTSAFSFFATAEAASIIGAKPVFVDIDPDTYNLDPARIEAAITPRTKAIVPVHLFGQPAQMTAIGEIARRRGLAMVEDVAQAFGGTFGEKKLGTFGAIGALSFFPTKNLGAYGDAGMLVTDDDALAQSCRALRAHGAKRKYFNEVAGYNSRLDAIQAAILRVKLPHVARWNDQRREAARRYTRMLEGVAGVSTPVEAPWGRHAFHQYTLRVAGGRRDELQAELAKRSIATMIYYPVPLNRLPLYAETAGRFPEAERAAAEVLSLPMWPGITEAIQRRVVEAIRSILTAGNR